MHRALLPNVLASLGLVLIAWAMTMPLFEWEISSINANYPPTYKVHIDPSPWTTKLGESLDDRAYIFHKIWVSIDQNTCMNTEGLNIMAKRSSNDKALELVSIKVNGTLLWLAFWSLIQIILSGIYMGWIMIGREHRPIADAIISTVTVVGLFCFLIGIMRLLGPIVSTDYFLRSDECHGALTFNARLSKVHYEMPIVMLLGISAELGAFGMMAREIIKTITQAKEASRSSVG